MAGTLSPSNGIDDRTYKTPLEIIRTVCFIVASMLMIYVIWTFVENRQRALNESRQQNEEDL